MPLVSTGFDGCIKSEVLPHLWFFVIYRSIGKCELNTEETENGL